MHCRNNFGSALAASAPAVSALNASAWLDSESCNRAESVGAQNCRRMKVSVHAQTVHTQEVHT